MNEKETMLLYRNDYLFSDLMLPVRKSQAAEELLHLEKEFAALIYTERYLIKYPRVRHYGKKKES